MKATDVYEPEPLAWHDLPDGLFSWEKHLRDVVAKAVVWLEMKDNKGGSL